MRTKILSLISLSLFFIFSCTKIEEKSERPVWSSQQAKEWYKQWGWLRGCNFNPSTAINQLEFWQAESFDTLAIDRELGWAASIGMNCMRVYLHHLAWEVDPQGFKSRMDKYLTIAHKHGIVTVFVFFDDCWNPYYKAGKQPNPKPGVHNSGWVRDPGNHLFVDNKPLEPVLEKYVKDVLTTFKDDKRILMWDLYNEPGNSGYNVCSMPLLKKVFKWGRTVNPSQPLTSGVWNYNLKELNKYQVENSDVITYHNYENEALHQKAIDTLKKYNKPLICTEYMARRNKSFFSNIMPMLKKDTIGAINWGLVSGKTNTKYAWDEPIPNGAEPKLWFHDIFRTDGSPYLQTEVNFIKEITSKK